MTVEMPAQPQVTERLRVRVRGRRRSAPRWRRWRWWIIAGGVALLAFLGIEGYRYASAALALQSGRDHVQAARELLSADLSRLSAARISAAQRDLDAAADDFGPRSQLLADGWLAHIGAGLPWLGDQINGVVALRSAGSTGTNLALDVVRLAQHLVASSPSDGSPLQRIVTLAEQRQSEIRTALSDLGTFQHALNAVPRHSLAGPLESARQTLLKDGAELTAGAAPALAILNALPAAIGPGTHHYLLLLENSGEERPAGGYIGAVGVIAFTDGTLTSLQFQDSATYPAPEPPLPIPVPLDHYLFQGQPLGLEDANWSPDFPTAMAEVERFYTADTGQTVDGDISIDPVAIEYLLQLLGPVQVAPYPQVITASNALTELNYIANRARPGDPGKAFLPPFGQHVAQAVLQAPVAQLPALAGALQRAAEEKHIVAYFHQAGVERLVTGAGFDGAVRPTTSDSVMVNDANLSGTKGDLFVKRQFHLDVQVAPDGNTTDRLTLTYTNPAVTDPADRALLPGSGGQYRDYLRVVLPETAQLQRMSRSVNNVAASEIAPDNVAYEFEQQLVGMWFAVPVGGTEQITLTYHGPLADISVNPERYQLSWMKQLNALDWPVSVRVHMPGGRTIEWSSTLSTDKSWSASDGR